MKHAGWIVAVAILILAAALVHTELSVMDGERGEWRVREDSLVNGWSADVEKLTALQAYTDSLRAYTDSVVMAYPPAPVVIRRALKAFEYAPLETAVDTLNAE